MKPEVFLNHLRKKLDSPLPGREAQMKMAHVARKVHESAPPDARKAGVLSLFFLKEEKWHLLFIERKVHPGMPHSGQIAFPGGKFEENDVTLERTALRETEEETGIPLRDVQLLGALSDLYIPVSNFSVFPFVGYLPYQPRYVIQTEEIAGILEVPLSYLQNPMNRRLADIPVGKYIMLKNVPCFDIFNKILWGATAMILSELLSLCPENDLIRLEY